MASKHSAKDKRILNFFPGPSALPEEVLNTAKDEMLNYENIGYGVMEMSHRSAGFTKIIETAEQNCRQLMNIPDNYKVLFLQGGCCGMFAAVPLNLLTEGGSADYVVTGTWSDKAAKEAEKYGKVNLVVPKPDKYIEVPAQDQWTFSKDAEYVFYCSNETIGGIEFDFIPQTTKPIVCDMSSNIMTREFDVTKFACIIAGAQKTLGPAGVTMIIIREDMIKDSKVRQKACPEVWNFENQAKMKSVYNTPPCYSIYIMGLVFKWMQKEGGVKHFDEQNKKKADLFYNTMKQSNGFYKAIINEGSQSRVNIPFRIQSDDALEKKFVEEAKKEDMDGLSGHRSVGGCRASFYNAIAYADVEKLCDFMRSFQLEHENCQMQSP